MGKLIVAMPAYNEADIIEKTINGLKTLKDIDDIVVINDGSTDNTLEVITKLDVEIIDFKENKGKGYALNYIFSNYEFDYICLVDADLGFSSIEIEKLINPVLRGEVDFTVAEFPRSKTKGGFGFVKNLARRGVYFFSKVEVNNSLSGQRVYRKEVIESIKYIPNDYGVEVAMTSQALKNGFVMKNIPVNMSHRYSKRTIKGFMHRGKQFWHILKTFIKMFFKRRRL